MHGQFKGKEGEGVRRALFVPTSFRDRLQKRGTWTAADRHAVPQVSTLSFDGLTWCTMGPGLFSHLW